jgi:hypothetical protein
MTGLGFIGSRYWRLRKRIREWIWPTIVIRCENSEQLVWALALASTFPSRYRTIATLDSGVFTIGATLIIPSNVHITGTGYETTIRGKS